MDLELNKEYWYIPGFRGDSLIAIKVKIIEIDDQFRKQHPESYLFYWVDEPVGHAVSDDELISRREAEDELMSRFEGNSEDEIADLTAWRTRSLSFIRGTHVRNAMNVDNFPRAESYPAKQQGVDWFNISDIKHLYENALPI